MTVPLLPLLAAALLPTVLLDLLLARFGVRRPVRLAVAVVFAVAMLIPWPDLSGAENLRGLVGDLSISSLVLLIWYLLVAFGPQTGPGSDPTSLAARLARPARELIFLAAILVGFAVFYYPLSLGVSMVDPYSHGFYPTVLTALLLAVFICAVLAGWPLTALLVALAFAGFVAHVLESDNLWDYLFDLPLALAALVWLLLRWRELVAAPWSSLIPKRVTVGALVLIACFLGFGLVLSRVNPELFAEEFTVEDGFVEWMTSIALLIAFVVSVRRFVRVRNRFGWRGKLVLLFVCAVSLFGAGEEISWGQRVFGIETPAALVERNAQREFNLHNLTFEWRGETIKINRLVFGRGLTLALLIYLFVMSPLYRRNDRFRRWIDQWAIPIPTVLQTVAYLAVVGVVEGLIDSPKRGELTEFAGAIVFLLNVALPYNRTLYQAGTAPARQASA
ncbi:MAG: hypothetical protein AB7G13_11270 [Lautropia sp.]